MKNRKYIFIFLMVIIGFFITLPYVMDTITKKDFDGTLASGTYESGGDVPEGVYDITSLSNGMVIDGIKLNKDEKLVNKELLKSSVINVMGDGQIKLLKTEDKQIELNDSKKATLNHQGYFVLDESFASGEYQISSLTSASVILIIHSTDSNKPTMLDLAQSQNHILNLDSGQKIELIRTNGDSELKIEIKKNNS